MSSDPEPPAISLASPAHREAHLEGRRARGYEPAIDCGDMGYVHSGCGANKAAERAARLVYPVGGAAPKPHSVGFETAFARIIEAGIIDPTKVVRVALENAVSVASVLLLTEATLRDIPEDNSSPQPGRFSEE